MRVISGVLSVSAASVLLFGVGCFDANPVNDQANAGELSVVATTVAADFSAGNVAFMAVEDFSVAENVIGDLYYDNLVKTYKGVVYILERFGRDNLIRLSGDSAGNYAVDYQVSLGSSANLSDIAFVSETIGYVTLNQSNALYKVNLATGAIVDSIDLSAYVAFAGTDSAQPYPFTHSAVFSNNHLFVTVQRLRVVEYETFTMFDPADTSLVLAIDRNDQVVGRIPLTFKNPAAISMRGDNMYVFSSGAYGVTSDGGVEVIDMASRTNKGVIARESDFGGDLSFGIIVSDTKGYACVSKASSDYTRYWTDLVPFDLSSGAAGEALSGIDNAFGGLACDGTYLYAGDRGVNNPGIVIYSIDDNTKVGATRSTGMPPYSLAILQR